MKNSEELLNLHQQMTSLAFKIMKVKNEDYSTESNPFSSFFTAQNVLNVAAEDVLMTRWLEKMTRSKNLITKGYSSDTAEPLIDTLIDSINYPILLAGLVEYRRNITTIECASRIFVGAGNAVIKHNVQDLPLHQEKHAENKGVNLTEGM